MLNTEDNDHVEVHEIKGFLSDTVHGALKEIEAVSHGTRCKQYLFSLNLSPPAQKIAPVEYFENALSKIEKELNLEGQPRVVVFHEKGGRRHAHCVWSRIRSKEMKAINLPFYKKACKKIGKELYLKYGWEPPPGLIDSKKSSPLNFTLSEWQQSERIKENPQTLKVLFQDCWAISANKNTFEKALKDQGFILAQGKKRGFVAVDYSGEIFSLSRWLNVKSKDLKTRLGDPEELPSVEEVKADITERNNKKPKEIIRQTEIKAGKEKELLIRKRQALRNLHHKQRKVLKERQENRWKYEEIFRSERLPTGLKAVWYRITGQYQKIRKQNERETKVCRIRDRGEKQTLVNHQLEKWLQLQTFIEDFEGYYNEPLSTESIRVL